MKSSLKKTYNNILCKKQNIIKIKKIILTLIRPKYYYIEGIVGFLRYLNCSIYGPVPFIEK